MGYKRILGGKEVYGQGIPAIGTHWGSCERSMKADARVTMRVDARFELIADHSRNGRRSNQGRAPTLRSSQTWRAAGLAGSGVSTSVELIFTSEGGQTGLTA